MKSGDGPRVATLGDPRASTCSVAFAREWLGEEGGEIRGYASFEEASHATLAGDAEFFLIPLAYPGNREFIFEPRLRLEEAFKSELPPIVLAEVHEPPEVRVATLYHHPALQTLADDLSCGDQAYEGVHVSSNAVACDRLIADPAAWALTNLIAAEAYGLRVAETMRAGWPMPVAVFAPARSGGPDVREYLGGRPSSNPSPTR